MTTRPMNYSSALRRNLFIPEMKMRLIKPNICNAKALVPSNRYQQQGSNTFSIQVQKCITEQLAKNRRVLNQNNNTRITPGSDGNANKTEDKVNQPKPLPMTANNRNVYSNTSQYRGYINYDNRGKSMMRRGNFNRNIDNNGNIAGNFSSGNDGQHRGGYHRGGYHRGGAYERNLCRITHTTNNTRINISGGGCRSERHVMDIDWSLVVVPQDRLQTAKSSHKQTGQQQKRQQKKEEPTERKPQTERFWELNPGKQEKDKGKGNEKAEEAEEAEATKKTEYETTHDQSTFRSGKRRQPRHERKKQSQKDKEQRLLRQEQRHLKQVALQAQRAEKQNGK